MKLSAKNAADKNCRAQKSGARAWRRLAAAMLCLLLLSSTMAGAFAAELPADETPPEITQDTTGIPPQTPETPAQPQENPPQTPETPTTPDTLPTTPIQSTENPAAPTDTEPNEDGEEPEPNTPPPPVNELITYTVTFRFNGGKDAAGNDSAVLMVPAGTSCAENNLPLPSPAKENSTLQGWCVLDESGAQTEAAFSADTPVGADVSVAAVWMPDSSAGNGEDNAEDDNAENTEDAEDAGNAACTIYYVSKELSESDKDKDFPIVLVDELNDKIVESDGAEYYLLEKIEGLPPDSAAVPAEKEGYQRQERVSLFSAAEPDESRDIVFYYAPAARTVKSISFIRAGTEKTQTPITVFTYTPTTDTDAETATKSAVTELEKIGYNVANKSDDTYVQAGDYDSYHYIDADGELQPVSKLPADAETISYLALPIEYDITYNVAAVGDAAVQAALQAALSAVTAPPDTRLAAALPSGKNPTLYTAEEAFELINPSVVSINGATYTFTGWTDTATTTPTQNYRVPANTTGPMTLTANWSLFSDVGTLTVSNAVKGEKADTAREFSFTVTINNLMVNGTFGGMSFTNSVANFKLTGGKSASATGLPAGAEFTVVETDANTSGYTTTLKVNGEAKTAAQGAISTNNTENVEFTNYLYNPVKVKITAQKTLNGRDPGRYVFLFDLKGADGTAQQVRNSGALISFAELSLERPGTYSYTITEYNDGRSGIRYDSHIYTAIITVQTTDTDDLKASVEYRRDNQHYSTDGSRAPVFINSSKAAYPGFVRTGDDANPALWAAAMVLAAAVIVAAVVVSRRKKKNNSGASGENPAEKSPEQPTDNSKE